MKYSLADYILNIQSNDPSIAAIFGGVDGLSIGGEGSVLDSLSINLDNNLWDTTSYATGGWVHSKNLSRSGTAQITLNQLSVKLGKLKQLCNMYYGGDYDGLTATLIDSTGKEIAKCEDCFVQKIPSQDFGQNAGTQTWTLTCGKITIN